MSPTSFSNGSGSKSSPSVYLMYLVIAFAFSIISILRSSYHISTTSQDQHLEIQEFTSMKTTTATTSATTTVSTDPPKMSIASNFDHDAQQKVREQQEQKEIVDHDDPSDNTNTTNKKLNVVLFYADDWTYYTLGAMGNKFVHTPNLDRLAREEGILFTRNCVVTSVCMQSRATLYTGQYSSVHKSFYAWKEIRMYDEGKWNQTLYPVMLQNNYHTGFFGKYHHIEEFPIPTFTKYHSAPMEHIANCHGQHKHVTQCNEDDGINFLMERPKDAPFFLTLSFFATHAQDDNPVHYIPQNNTEYLYSDDDMIPNPKTHTDEHWNALPAFLRVSNLGRIRYQGRYDTPSNFQNNMKRMYRMAAEVDATCGRIMDLLKEQNVYDDTVIIFTTDNGNFHGEHGLSEKWFAYEESIRVPLIIKDPRIIPSLKGTVNDEFTLNIDLAPTILSAANIPVPEIMQGRDMATMYMESNERVQSSRQTWRKEFLYEFFWSDTAIPNSLALVNKDSKYIYWNDNNYSQFFNLTEDPFEENDIHTTLDPSVQTDLHERLLQLQVSVQSGVTQ